VISKHQQIKKKSAATALKTVLASAHPNGLILVVNLMEPQQAIAKTPAK
jgi:hypothetical protein